MTEYERMGNGGTRAATIIVNQSAMCYFEEFLQAKYVFSIWSENYYLLLRRFGKSRRLFYAATKKSGGESS